MDFVCAADRFLWSGVRSLWLVWQSLLKPVLAVRGKDGSRFFSFADAGFFLGSSFSAMAAGNVAGRRKLQRNRGFDAADGKPGVAVAVAAQGSHYTAT